MATGAFRPAPAQCASHIGRTGVDRANRDTHAGLLDREAQITVIRDHHSGIDRPVQEVEEEMPLRAPFAGCWSARRGTYRVWYRIDEERHAVIVLDIVGRSDAYRPGRA